jgi:TfoX/Sxy family transcriptional regulator of competence genes
MYTIHASLDGLGLVLRSFFAMRIRYSAHPQTVPQGVPMAFDEKLAERIPQRLVRHKNVEERKMFGGVGLLLNGNLLVGVWKDSLCVRLGPDQAEETLLELHATEFDITGRPMKGWALVEPEGVTDDDQLKGWIQRAAQFVGKLPGK